MQGLPLPWAILDLHGRVVSCNHALERFLGRTSEQLTGVRLPTAFTTRQDAAQEGALFLELVDGQRDEYRLQKRFQTQDGDWKTGVVHVAVVRPPAPQGPFCVCCILDITDMVRGAELRRRAAKLDAVARLAAEIVHRLNHHLLSGTGHLRLLAESLAQNDPARTALEPIQKAVQEAGQLVRDLVFFSSRPIADPVPCDLNALVQNVATSLRTRYAGRLQVDLHCTPDLPRVLADPNHLHRAFATLVDFAAHRTPLGGRLRIHTLCMPPHATISDDTLLPRRPGMAEENQTRIPSGHRVAVQIADEGPLPDAKLLERMFEPFAAAEGLEPKTSLDLAAAYGIVRQFSGVVDVRLAGDKGLQLTLAFPATAETVPEFDLPANLADTQASTPTVLIVEDDESLRSQYRQIIKSQGFRVLEAGHGGEALLVCLRHPGPIEVLLADSSLLLVPSSELARQLGAIRPHMRFVLLGNQPSTDSPHGPDVAWVAKPVEAETLIQALRQACQGLGGDRIVAERPSSAKRTP